MDIINLSSTTFFQKAFDILGISQDAFARLVNKSPARISRYLSGSEVVPDAVFAFAMDALSARMLDPSSLFPLSDEADYYYHATTMEIVFPIDVHWNDGGYNDFGNGFYLGESFRQAITWGKESSPTSIYCFHKSKFRKAKEYVFSNALDWLFYVGLNRGKVLSMAYPEYETSLKKAIARYDVIRGSIADSFSFNVIELLFAGRFDVDQAEAATVIMALGNQRVIKSQEFASSLLPDRLIKLDKTLSRYFLYYGQKAQHGFDALISGLLEKSPNEERKFARLAGKWHG